MGLEYYCVTFIGRVCTEEESERCYNAMKDLNTDENIDDRLFSIEYAGPESIFKSDDGLPIVAHNFNYCMATKSELLEYEKEDFVFYVVQKDIINTSDRYGAGDLIPVPLNSLPVPKDERYGLLQAHYIA